MKNTWLPDTANKQDLFFENEKGQSLQILWYTDDGEHLIIENLTTKKKWAIKFEKFVSYCRKSDKVSIATLLAVLDNENERKMYLIDILSEMMSTYHGKVAGTDYANGAYDVMVQLKHSEQRCKGVITQQVVSLKNTVKQVEEIIERECRREVNIANGMAPEIFDAKVERDNIYKIYAEQIKQNPGRSYEENKPLYKEMDEKQDAAIFIMTWEDTPANLNFVLKEVKTRFPGTIYHKYVTNVIRKGRRDVYILTSDNVLFKKTFYDTLRDMKETGKKEQDANDAIGKSEQPQTPAEWVPEFPEDFPYSASVGDGGRAKLCNIKDKHGHVVAFLKTKTPLEYAVRLTIAWSNPKKKVIGALRIPSVPGNNPVFVTRRDATEHFMHNSDSVAFNYALVDYLANYRFSGQDVILRVEEKGNGGKINIYFLKAKRLYDAIKTGEAHVEQHSNAEDGVKYEPQIFFPRDILKIDTEAYKRELLER